MITRAVRPPCTSLLTEVVCDDPQMRFAACTAVSTTVMGYGLRACRTPAEHAVWLANYADWLTAQVAAVTGSLPDALG
jgi:hypothetical protein